MAVRTAFALGLHRCGDTCPIFDSKQVVIRQNLWRSLFVLDRFLAASLGRPTAISEEDCSGDSLEAPHVDDGLPHEPSINAKSLDAAVRSCQSIGHVLKKIYSVRKVSTNLAQTIAGECEASLKDIHKDLNAQRLFDGSLDAADGMAILHVQLLGCHSIILLTRPFFLYLLSRTQKEKDNSTRPPNKSKSRLERFSETCVAASIQTISLVYAAYKWNYVSRRNPFIL